MKVKVTKKAGLKKYNDVLKRAEKYYKLGQKGIPKNERIPFKDTEDYKVIAQRKKRAEYYYNNRKKITTQNREYKARAAEKVKHLIDANYTEIASGPAFQVLAYNDKAYNAVMFVQVDSLATQPNFRGIIKVPGAAKKIYTTKDKYFDAVRDLFNLLRTIGSDAYAVISQYTDADYFIQKILVTIGEDGEAE